MPKEKETNRIDKSESDEEKIQFGEKSIVCFACGQEIDEKTNKCPYCGTKHSGL